MTAHPTAFGATLALLRHKRHLSQSALAEAAGLDHSAISRLEAGNRNPTRESVLFIAEALRLTSAEEDVLLAKAGYMPADVTNLFRHEQVVADLLAVLDDGDLSLATRDDVRAAVAAVCRLAGRT